MTGGEKDELWRILLDGGAKPHNKAAALASIDQVLEHHVRVPEDTRHPPPSEQRDQAEEIRDTLVKLGEQVQAAAPPVRKRFYRSLAKANGQTRSKAGKALFGRMRADLLSAAEFTYERTQRKVRRGREVAAPAMQETMVALAQIWKRFTGDKFHGSKQNPYSGNVSKKALSARFVARALQVGCNTKIRGSTEYAFDRTRKLLKHWQPPSTASSESSTESGSGSSGP